MVYVPNINKPCLPFIGYIVAAMHGRVRQSYDFLPYKLYVIF